MIRIPAKPNEGRSPGRLITRNSVNSSPSCSMTRGNGIASKSFSTATKEFIMNKQANSNIRERLVQQGIVKVSGANTPGHIPMEEVAELQELRRKGARACSRVDAIIARRAEFKGN